MKNQISYKIPKISQIGSLKINNNNNMFVRNDLLLCLEFAFFQSRIAQKMERI